MEKFEILISSPPDRNKLVAEIWFENRHIAEINHENDYLEIEIYPSKMVKVCFEDFVKVLKIAKEKLYIDI